MARKSTARTVAMVGLAENAARNDWLRGVRVELHGEGEHQGVEVFVQRGEVEAEDVTGGIDRVGLLLWLDGNVAEHAGLGGVGGGRDRALGLRHGNGSENDRGGVAVDVVMSGLLGDG